MRVLVYDTETTGLPDWKQPSESEHQPHIVELAALLFDTNTRELIAKQHTLIKPDGWIIPDDVAAIHGITTERAATEGIPEAEALAGFLDLHAMTDLRVAHNESFDARLMRICIKRFAAGDTQEARDLIADAFKAAPAYCTCNSAKPIMKLPATEAMRRNGKGHWFKPPNLQEAHQHFLGQTFEGAHSALEDAHACARVYFAIQALTRAAA
ncbi:3'-5' exonuclease [Luteibacter yeojuensis]|uniref:3'-5' exonuclease n=1 Tax=Luteibacter yeojuensis TaxID=345309 RepID=A0A7X5QT89_9GAMM|nr:3'-5' exonuclease [Luteibacter yeojuensis]NID15013.1 3'-5' exonuclease [Luteibacter yeojuensis]